MLKRVETLQKSWSSVSGGGTPSGPTRPSAGEPEVQQDELLVDGNTVLVTQEVAPDGDDEGFPWEGEEGLDPLCCQLDVLHLRTWSCRSDRCRTLCEPQYSLHL